VKCLTFALMISQVTRKIKIVNCTDIKSVPQVVA
jgi:hypothetical protein